MDNMDGQNPQLFPTSGRQQILFYRGNEIPYGVFSNFDRKHPIKLEGKIWPSTEHYFQAKKFEGTPHEEEIRNAPLPRDAASMGRDRNRPLRADWENVKDDIMRKAVMAKFSQYPELRYILIETGNAELVEHTINDSYWADGGDGTGKNMLGRILMEVREKLRFQNVGTGTEIGEEPQIFYANHPPAASS